MTAKSGKLDIQLLGWNLFSSFTLFDMKLGGKSYQLCPDSDGRCNIIQFSRCRHNFQDSTTFSLAYTLFKLIHIFLPIVFGKMRFFYLPKSVIPKFSISDCWSENEKIDMSLSSNIKYWQISRKSINGVNVSQISSFWWRQARQISFGINL